MPLCLSSASILGLRPRNAVNDSSAGRLPPSDLAPFLLFGLYTLAMMVKVYPDRAQLERAAAVTLAVLDS